MRSCVLSAALAPAMVAALFWDGPQPTSVDFNYDPHGMSPQPTNAPEFDFELVRRQATDDGRTCGYVTSNSANALTCNMGYVCAQNDKNGVVGCCEAESVTSGCIISTSCVPYGQLSSVSTSVLLNTFVTKCTNVLAPYCYTAAFILPGTTQFYLGCSSASKIETAYQSYSGGISLTSKPVATGTTRVTTGISSAVVVASVGSSTPSTAPGTSTTSSSPFNTVSPSPTTEPKKKTSVGAIVGGVIGGLAVIGAVVFGAVFLCLKKKKKNNAAASQIPPQGSHPQMGQQPQYPPMPPQQGYYPQAQQPGAMPPQHGHYPQAGALPPKQDVHANTQPINHGHQQPYSPPVSPGPNAASPVAPPYQPAVSPPLQNVAEMPAVSAPQKPQGGNVYEVA